MVIKVYLVDQLTKGSIQYWTSMERKYMNTQTDNNEIEIDLLHLIKVLWQKAWIIALSLILCGVIAFSYAFFFVTPQYQAKAMMYVNNSSFSVGSTSFSISSSELSAAKTLLDIYVVILNSRTTLEAVISEAGLDYTYKELGEMVSAGAVNGTEVFEIVATSSDPAEAEVIVDTITDILPDRISEIVDGSSVRIVDTAILPTERSSPSYSRFAVIGMLLGFVASCGVIIVLDLLDNTLRDEDYLMEKYQLPVLAAVPDMNNTKKNEAYSHYYAANTTYSNQ